MTRAVRLAAVLLVATVAAASAEVCDKERPAWNPADGPVGALGEMLANLLSVPGLVVVAVAFLAMWSKSVWVPLVLCLFPFALAWLIHFGHNDPMPLAAEMRDFARQEGCVGPPGLAIAVFVLMGVALLTRAAMLHRARIIP